MVQHPSSPEIGEIERLQHRIERDPADTEASVRLGALLYEPGHQPEQAIEVLRREVDRDPSSGDAKFWLAYCLWMEYHATEEAASLLESALRADPDRPDCLTILGSVRREQGRPPEECVPLVERAVRVAPDWIAPREQLATLYLEMSRFDEAEAEATRALSLISQVEVPPGSIEEFELVVTGRMRSRGPSTLELLIDRIRRARQVAAKAR